MSEAPIPSPDELHARSFFGVASPSIDEYYWTSMLGEFLNARDLERRPLGEEVAIAACRAEVSMELRACPYSGSRAAQPVPMNVSSLKQFGAHWGETVALLHALRRAAASGRAILRPDLFQLWKLTKLAIVLPAYLMRRTPAALADGQLPVDAAIVYRMALGLHRVVHVRLVMALATGMDEQLSVVDPAALYRFADTNLLFFGTQSVCAGPQAMIEESYAIMNEPTRAGEEADHPLVDDGFLRYANALLGLEIEKYLFALRATIIQRQLLTSLRARDDDPALRGALEEFEIFCATRTSTLAQEIAGAEPEQQERIFAGLARIRGAFEDERPRLGMSSWSGWLRPYATPSVPAERRARAAALLAGGGASPSASLDATAEALLAYLALERDFLGVFARAQQAIDAARGAGPTEALRLTHDDVIRAFGPKLSDFAATHLGVSIRTAVDATELSSVAPKGAAMPLAW